MRNIEFKINIFREAFKSAHGRAPVPRDLECAVYVRERHLVERYNQLNHGKASLCLSRGLARGCMVNQCVCII